MLADAVNQRGLKYYENEKFVKILINLVDANKRIIRSVFSEQMEQHMSNIMKNMKTITLIIDENKQKARF